MIITRAHCGKEADKFPGAVNRARKQGKNLYCSKACSSLAKRNGISDAEKVARKAAYDAEYREKNREMLKAKKAAHYKANPNREREKAYREANMHRHVEYCRRPEYRAQKREYDKEYRAKQEFGEFWESALLILDIHRTALNLAGSGYELRKAKGYYDNTTQTRRRDYERLDRKEPEIGALGNLERGERR